LIRLYISKTRQSGEPRRPPPEAARSGLDGGEAGAIQASTRNSVEAMREVGNAVREINEVTSNIASAVGEQDAATRESFG
jgi:methyl-accepting chemotaxis protein